MQKLKVLFAASSKIAIPTFQKLLEISSQTLENNISIEIMGVLTVPDAPKLRKSTPIPNDFANYAEKACKNAKIDEAFKIYKPNKLNNDFTNEISSQKPDLLICFSYRKIFPISFLHIFKYGSINFHPSLLPRWRGPSPIQTAILARDSCTGVSLQQIAEKMDSGDIFLRAKIPLCGNETGISLFNTASEKAAELLPEFFKRFPEILEKGEHQNEADIIYCRLLSSNDGELDLGKSAEEIDAQVRAFTPWPPCYTFWNGKKLFFLEGSVYSETVNPESGTSYPSGKVLGTDINLGIIIQCGAGLYILRRLQLEGKKELDWKAFLNGAKDFIGCTLGAA